MRTLNAGTNLGRYKILSALGAGGMGEVFLADDTQLRRKIALQILRAAPIHNHIIIFAEKRLGNRRKPVNPSLSKLNSEYANYFFCPSALAK